MEGYPMNQTVTDAKATLTAEFTRARREGGGHVMECDEGINDASRGVIRSMFEHTGGAWLGNINRPKTERGKPAIERWDGESQIYNFGCDFVLPGDAGADAVLAVEIAIQEREAAPYAGTRDDTGRVARIMAAIDAAGGAHLIWS